MSDGRRMRLCCCFTNRKLVGRLQLPLLGQAFQMSELRALNIHIVPIPTEINAQYSYSTSYQKSRLSVSVVLRSFCFISFGFNFLGSCVSCQSNAK